MTIKKATNNSNCKKFFRKTLSNQLFESLEWE